MCEHNCAQSKLPVLSMKKIEKKNKNKNEKNTQVSIPNTLETLNPNNEALK